MNVPKAYVKTAMRSRSANILAFLLVWPAAALLPADRLPAEDDTASSGPTRDDRGADDEAPEARQYWPEWRGPHATGASFTAVPPVEWSESRGETKNVRWKTRLPGLGHSSPVVWGDYIFVTTAVPYGEPFPATPDTAPGAHDNLPVTQRHQFDVLAVRRTDGKVLWRRSVHKGRPHEGGHYTGSLASNSPATDGKRVFAFFGSRGLYCLDFTGKTQWQRSFEKMQSKHAHGEGSSPALHGDTIVINWDHEGQSWVSALDKKTGKERWRVERGEVTSWASPIVYTYKGRPQLIVSGTARVRGYDLATGKVIWQCGGLSHNVVASPVAGDGMVFAASSYETRAMFAIRLDGAEGDLTGSDHVVWSRRHRTPYVPSPLLYKGSLYFLRHYQGILSRVEAKSGEEKIGPFRLEAIRNVYASPVAAGGRIYITDRAGTTMVISHEDEPRVLAVNRLEDSFSASAALVEDQLILRGEKFLYCLAED